MDATAVREELEAAIWRIAGREIRSPAVSGVLDIAEVYAEAVADERIGGHVTARMAGYERLAAATAERYGRPLTPCGTASALRRHRKNDDERCETCLAAERDRWEARAARRNAARRESYRQQRQNSEG